MAVAGPPWALDLTAADPFGILLVAAVSLWILNVHRVKSSKEMARQMLHDAGARQKKDLLIKLITARTSEWLVTGVQALALLSFPYVINVPSGVALLWTVNATCTLVQR